MVRCLRHWRRHLLISERSESFVSLERIKQKIPFYILVLPAVMLSVAVIFIPSLTTIGSSFTDWNGISSNMNFVGLQNYQELLANETFTKALTNNLKWMSMYLVIPVSLAMGASICLLHIKQRTFFQVIFLLPYVVAPIANALIWLDVIYSPVTGLFGYLRSHFGWMWLTSPLTKPSSALFGVAAVDIWHYWGYLCVVYLAALRQTPADHLEAATLDGCTGWQLFRYIYFPSMLPTFKLMMMLIVIQSFMQFDYVYLLTSGGPANATEMMGTQTYTYAFTLFQFGKAGAIAVMMSLIGLVASVIYTRLSRNEAD